MSEDAAGALSSTFRDPVGSLHFSGGRVLRRLKQSAATDFDRIAFGPQVSEMTRAGRIVATSRLEADAVPAPLRAPGAVVYEHARVPFVSYPAEWSAVMLADAARFTLDLCSDLLEHGLILKDATPANILYRGTQPVLVDVPSIVERTPGDYLWLARNQFETTFLLPLIAAAEMGVPLSWSLAYPASGLTHEAAAKLLGGRRWRRPSLISTVALPAALNARASTVKTAARPATGDERKARFILKHGFDGLRRKIDKLAARLAGATSNWRDYTTARAHYESADLDAKRRFVSECLQATRPQWALDIGSNTGEFSELAAGAGASVVALDLDDPSVGGVFDRARTRSLDVLPLVVNIARPTPATGWRNQEASSFIDRGRQRFDAVLMLAVIHHLRVGEGVPLERILDLAAELTRGHLIIEWVPATDPMFVTIARGREPLYDDWTRENFVRLIEQRFTVERVLDMNNQRALYLVRRRA